jgi:hypothetical protein
MVWRWLHSFIKKRVDGGSVFRNRLRPGEDQGSQHRIRFAKAGKSLQVDLRGGSLILTRFETEALDSVHLE